MASTAVVRSDTHPGRMTGSCSAPRAELIPGAAPGDGGLDALAVLRRRIDGVAAGAALEDDIPRRLLHRCGHRLLAGRRRAGRALTGGLAENSDMDVADAAQPVGVHPYGAPAPGMLGVGW